MALDDRYRTMPFAEAVAFLRDKISLDTEGWNDIADDEFDAFFTVAGAKGNLLADLREAVDRALAMGSTLTEFADEFELIAENWAHRGDRDWRARIIYQTNMRMTHAAGRNQYQLDPEVLRVQPYRQYVHSDSTNPRPAHLALDGKVFLATEVPFETPNGFGCSCRYISLSQRELERAGLEVSTLRRGDTVPVEIEGQTYNPVLEPEQGWDYTPGMARDERRQELIEGVLARSSPAVREQIEAELSQVTSATRTTTPPIPASPPTPTPPETSPEPTFPTILLEQYTEAEGTISVEIGSNLAEIKTGFDEPSESIYRVGIEDIPELEVSIEVNSSLSAGSVEDSREGIRIALALRRQMNAFVRGLPDGQVVYCSPYGEDGLGEGRATLYERVGFTPPNEWEEQFAIVSNGRLIPITPEQIAELRRASR
ncbi:MAG: phage minor head protein [Cyanobacteria bacterium J06638_20]